MINKNIYKELSQYTLLVGKKSLYFSVAFIIMHNVAITPKSLTFRELHHKEAVSLFGRVIVSPAGKNF